MPHQLPKHVSLKIEAICAQGCTEVNLLLKRAGQGKRIQTLSTFSDAEICQIIEELTEIMSVYENKPPDQQ